MPTPECLLSKYPKEFLYKMPYFPVLCTFSGMKI